MSKLKSLLSKYESNGFGEKIPFFALKDHGDSAEVRILLHDEDEILGFTKEVHRIVLNGYNNKVLCLDDDCVLCRNGLNPSLRIMIPLWNMDTNQLEMWERGKQDIGELLSLMEEYGALDEQIFKIKRNGKKGSTSTTYTYLPKGKNVADNIEVLKEAIPEIVGRDFRYILKLSPAQQREALETKTVTFKKPEDATTTSQTTTITVEDDDLPF